MNLAKNLRKYFRRRFWVKIKKEERFMKCSLRMLFIVTMAMVLVVFVISVGFAQEKVTITVEDYFLESDIGKFVDEMAIGFEKSHPNVKIDHVSVPFAELLPTVLQQSLTNTLPDIIMADNPWVPQFIKAGVYLSLIHISEPTRLGMISYAVF